MSEFENVTLHVTLTILPLAEGQDERLVSVACRFDFEKQPRFSTLTLSALGTPVFRAFLEGQAELLPGLAEAAQQGLQDEIVKRARAAAVRSPETSPLDQAAQARLF